MGWCSATELVDAAIQELLAAVTDVSGTGSTTRSEVDARLRPHVRRLAARFRAHDWDCVEESDFYDRFGPELRGETDVEHVVRQYQTFEDEPLRFVEWLDRFRAAGREVPGWSLDEGV